MNPHPELVDGVDVDEVARRVRTCPGIDDLDAGAVGSVVSYLPGRRLPGVRVDDDVVTIQVRIGWGARVPDAARAVRTAVREVVGSRRVDVVVSDVAVPAEDNQADTDSPRGGDTTGGDATSTPSVTPTSAAPRAARSSASTTPIEGATPRSS